MRSPTSLPKKLLFSLQEPPIKWKKLSFKILSVRSLPTLDGKVKIKIPEGTQTGKLFRLRGKGITPIRGGSQGDLLCRAIIETPQNLSKQQKQILKDFQDSISQDSSQNPMKAEWFSKVKSFFDTKD